MTDMQAMRDRYFSNSALFGRWDRPALEYQDREARLSHAQTLRFRWRVCAVLPNERQSFY